VLIRPIAPLDHVGRGGPHAAVQVGQRVAHVIALSPLAHERLLDRVLSVGMASHKLPGEQDQA